MGWWRWRWGRELAGEPELVSEGVIIGVGGGLNWWGRGMGGINEVPKGVRGNFGGGFGGGRSGFEGFGAANLVGGRGGAGGVFRIWQWRWRWFERERERSGGGGGGGEGGVVFLVVDEGGEGSGGVEIVWGAE